MSNVIISYNWPYKTKNGISPTMCFYDGLRIALEESNHDVLEINTANFCTNVEIDEISKNSILEINNNIFYEQIKLFKPDLIIVFNHCITQEMYDITDCPIFVWDGDSPISSWWYNTHLIKDNINRLTFGYTMQRNRDFYKKLWQIPDNKLFPIKLATSLKAKELKFERDVCFIGSIAKAISQNISIYYKTIQNDQDRRRKFAQDIKQIVKDGIYEKLSEDLMRDIGISFEELYWHISQMKRNDLLKLLSDDLNVELFGWTNLDFSDGLFMYHNNMPTYSVEHNENVYNSSKIALNINQPQVCNEKSKYSWRVCDIMATNACLVSTECAALDQDFGKWVEIPQFSNKHEAYDICNKLLAEENWRKDIVAGSKLAIKEGKFTFYDRVKELEEIFNLKQNENKKELKYEFLLDNTTSAIVQKKCSSSLKKMLYALYYLNFASIFRGLKLEGFVKKISRKL